MPRPLRIEYEGAAYHVMCRGNRGMEVFNTDADKLLWLSTLGEACERCQMVVHAYCLMTNHYHLLLETPRGNLSAGMKWLQATFTQKANRVAIKLNNGVTVKSGESLTVEITFPR